MGYSFQVSILDCSALEEFVRTVSSDAIEDFQAAQTSAENQLVAFQKEMSLQGRLLHASDVTRCSGALEEHGPLSSLGEVYSEIRSYLPTEDREIYDSIYVPFVGPWMKGFGDPYPPVSDVSDPAGCLKKHGMGWILNAERCANMAAVFSKCSFSRLIHVLYARGKDLPPATSSTLYVHQMLSPQFDDLHSMFTAMTEGWRILTTEARNRKWGMMIVG
jgi:hypothetical protein